MTTDKEYTEKIMQRVDILRKLSLVYNDRTLNMQDFFGDLLDIITEYLDNDSYGDTFGHALNSFYLDLLDIKQRNYTATEHVLLSYQVFITKLLAAL